MRKSIVAIAILAFFAFSLVPVFASDSCCASKTKSASVKKTEILCPVMGGKITNVSKAAGKTVYKGKTYYFCCPSCKTAFNKNPEKYIKAIAKSKASGVCPMTGKKVCCDKKTANCKCPCDAAKMKKVCTTCGTKNGKCPVTAVKKPVSKTVSAVCPVMGSKIPDVTKASGKSVYKGKTYYFCCAGCKPAFDKNPEKYIKK